MPHKAMWTPFVLYPRNTCTFSKHYHLNTIKQAKNTECKCIFCEALTWALIINNGKSQTFSNLLLNQQTHESISYTHRHSHIHTQRYTHRQTNFILPLPLVNDFLFAKIILHAEVLPPFHLWHVVSSVILTHEKLSD